MKNFFGALITALAFLPLGFALAALFELAGAKFADAFTGVFLSAAVGTFLWAKIQNSPIIIFPELSMASSLIYIDVISRGIAFETALASAFAAALVGALLLLCKIPEKFSDKILYFLRSFFLSVKIKALFLAGLAFFLLLEGLYQGRLLLPSPFYFAMTGDIENPVAALSLVGILILIVLYSSKLKFAMILSTAFVAILSYLEGYIAIDEVFYAPDRYLNFKFIEAFPSVDLTLKILFIMWLLGFTLSDLFAKILKCDNGRGMFAVFVSNIAGAFFGVFMLLPSPLSAAAIAINSAENAENNVKISYITALFFLLFVFLEPLAESLRSFTAIYAPAIVGAGMFMLLAARKILQTETAKGDEESIAEIVAGAAFMIIFPLTRDMFAAVLIAFIMFTVLNVAKKIF